MSSRRWVVYILRCSDDTFYTGITTDLEARLKKHNEGGGAKYTRGRTPCQIVFTEQHPDKSSAAKRESAIKKMPSRKKISLIG